MQLPGYELHAMVGLVVQVTTLTGSSTWQSPPIKGLVHHWDVDGDNAGLASTMCHIQHNRVPSLRSFSFSALLLVPEPVLVNPQSRTSS